MSAAAADTRFAVLDGWRGISILLVLATHLLPLGPKAWHLNVATGLLGMALFFVLSGFLVTHMLLHRDGVLDFLLRRAFRILPLAWLYMTLMLLIHPVTSEAWLAHLLFYANYPPKPLIPVTELTWSLCVEIHFYLGIAALVGLCGRRALWWVLPLLCVAVTLLRVGAGMHFSVITHFRIDEILAGATLALACHSPWRVWLARAAAGANVPLLALLLLVSCHPDSGFMNYLRPYLAALLVGVSLLHPPPLLARLLEHRLLGYIATISYALYMLHPFLASTWLGSGSGWEKYAKRPLLFALLFASAHLSTFYFEQRWIAFGKRLTHKRRPGGAYELE